MTTVIIDELVTLQTVRIGCHNQNLTTGTLGQGTREAQEASNIGFGWWSIVLLFIEDFHLRIASSLHPSSLTEDIVALLRINPQEWWLLSLCLATERREAKVIEVAQLFWAMAMVEFHEEELGSSWAWQLRYGDATMIRWAVPSCLQVGCGSLSCIYFTGTDWLTYRQTHSFVYGDIFMHLEREREVDEAIILNFQNRLPYRVGFRFLTFKV